MAHWNGCSASLFIRVGVSYSTGAILERIQPWARWISTSEAIPKDAGSGHLCPHTLPESGKISFLEGSFSAEAATTMRHHMFH